MSTPKRSNSRGNWWYVDDPCIEEGCNTLIDSCDNEYTYHSKGQRIIRCREHYLKLNKERNDINPRHPDTNQRIQDWITGRARHYYGGIPKDRKTDQRWKECFAKAKEDAKAIAWVIPDGETTPITEHSNVVPFPEKDKTKRLPSFVRNTDLPTGIRTESECKADKQVKRTKYVPQGWLYAMRDHLKSDYILKCGKTNDLGKRLSEANTWGDFEILYWVRVSHAKDAEDMMHDALFGKRKLREWFRVSIEEAREVMDLCAEEYYWPEEQNNESQ